MPRFPRPALFRLLLLTAALSQPLAAQDATAPPTDAPRPNYTYNVEFLRVVDANTVALDIDLGFGIWLRNQNLDLQGLPEPVPMATETPAQKTARLAQASRLRDLLTNRTELILTTTNDKSTTPPRYLATLWADGVNVNEAVLQPDSAQ